MSLLYMTVDLEFLSFYKNYTDSGPLLQLPTKHLHWPCTELDLPCNPEEYVKS